MTEQRDRDRLPPPTQPLSEPTEDKKLVPVEESWTDRLAGIWHSATSQVTQRLPVEQAAQKIVDWFSVSDARVAEILAAVRAQLPATEALLIGKPQAGKSSIVRGLTGVSDEIVGQGFRPHTQHTERYAYPSEEVPLLIFTDTVGLGDINQNIEATIEELLGELQPDGDRKAAEERDRARIVILTVKIDDFATDTLRHIATQLREKYPNIPCLLAVTCLHELYPPSIEDHPLYPPEFEEVQRAFAAIKASFEGICDRAILLDFTLEEDGYSPVFYGLEAFRDTLGDLLPEAEARALYQLLEGETGQQIGNLYRDTARRYIAAFSAVAATLAAVPLPFATMPVLTAVQISMVGLLGNLYGQTLAPSQAGGVVSALTGGFLAQAIGRELVKFIPILGSAIAASWAAAYTWALGEGACVYFGDLMGGKKPDPQKIQATMREAFDKAKERFKSVNSNQ